MRAKNIKNNEFWPAFFFWTIWKNVISSGCITLRTSQENIKKALGISAIAAEYFTWRSGEYALKKEEDLKIHTATSYR